MAIWHGTSDEVGHLGIQAEPFWARREAGVAPSVVKLGRCWDGAGRDRVTIGEKIVRPSKISLRRHSTHNTVASHH